jgi:hypothetical protein
MLPHGSKCRQPLAGHFVTRSKFQILPAIPEAGTEKKQRLGVTTRDISELRHEPFPYDIGRLLMHHRAALIFSLDRHFTPPCYDSKQTASASPKASLATFM